VLPIGAYNAEYGVTLSLPGVVGRQGVTRILEPSMSNDEQEALRRSAEVLRKAVRRISGHSVATECSAA
jgi:L-lactate dehydrogenase